MPNRPSDPSSRRHTWLWVFGALALPAAAAAVLPFPSGAPNVYDYALHALHQ